MWRLNSREEESGRGGGGGRVEKNGFQIFATEINNLLIALHHERSQAVSLYIHIYSLDVKQEQKQNQTHNKTLGSWGKERRQSGK